MLDGGHANLLRNILNDREIRGLVEYFKYFLLLFSFLSFLFTVLPLNSGSVKLLIVSNLKVPPI